MVAMRNFNFMVFLLVLNNYSATQQQCRDYKNDNKFPREQIYLLQSSVLDHSLINYQFIFGNGYHKTMEIMESHCELEVKDIIEYSKYFPYLINLYVPNFYKNNYNKVKESLVYAGDMNYPKTSVTVCKSVKEPTDGIHRCEPITYAEKKYTKLCTSQIETKYKEIFENVVVFQSEKWFWYPSVYPHFPPANTLPIIEIPLVIICGKTIHSGYYRSRFFKLHFDKCNDNEFFVKTVRNDTLAILTGALLNMPRPIDNPVVFYKEAYITKETKDWFKNAVAGFPWQSLKYGFLFFMKKMGWMRVAIISDSTEFSHEFEQDLTTSLSENGITYMAETCLTSNCNEVINKIVKSGVKIIIANLDIDNMRKPGSYANLKNLVRYRDVKWITRNLNVSEAREAVNLLNSDIFNIYFETDYSLSDIYQVINMIRNQVNCDAEYCSFSKSEAAALLKASLKTSTININNLIKNRLPKAGIKIGSITVVNDTLTMESINYPHHIEDSYIYCTIRNNRFENPCNDIELVLLMVVITVFVLTVLGVVLFFEAPEFGSSYRRIR